MSERNEFYLGENTNIEKGQHNGNNYFGCTFAGNGTSTCNAAGEMYEEITRPNIWWRIIAVIVSFAADIIGIFTGLNPYYDNENGGALNIFFSFFSDNNGEKIGAVAYCFLIIIAIYISGYLLKSLISLLNDSRHKNLRRIGKRVVEIRTKRCPLCGDWLRLVYDRGNYLECRQSPREHRWLVQFTNRKD